MSKETVLNAIEQLRWHIIRRMATHSHTCENCQQLRPCDEFDAMLDEAGVAMKVERTYIKAHPKSLIQRIRDYFRGKQVRKSLTEMALIAEDEGAYD